MSSRSIVGVLFLIFPSACGGASSKADHEGGIAGGASAGNAGNANASTAGSATTGGNPSGGNPSSGSPSSGSPSSGSPSGGTAAGGRCTDSASAAPDPGPFEAPQPDSFGTYEVSFENHCERTIWPAWGRSGGLDSSVIAPQLWVALPPQSERKVTVYGGLRDIGFWGRTGCSFDEAGQGACASGDCGSFVCPPEVNSYPSDATVFELRLGFSGGYNVPLRVVGEACGSHECVAELDTCESSSVIRDECGAPIACDDICPSHAECCDAGARCADQPTDDASGDLVLTFCP